jgi:hypothetical protein
LANLPNEYDERNLIIGMIEPPSDSAPTLEYSLQRRQNSVLVRSLRNDLNSGALAGPEHNQLKNGTGASFRALTTADMHFRLMVAHNVNDLGSHPCVQTVLATHDNVAACHKTPLSNYFTAR